MALTKEQYDALSTDLDSDEFYGLSDLAYKADTANLIDDLNGLRERAKTALDYEFSDSTHDAVESLYDEIEGISFSIQESIQAIEKIEEQLSKAEDVLTKALYQDDDY